MSIGSAASASLHSYPSAPIIVMHRWVILVMHGGISATAYLDHRVFSSPDAQGEHMAAYSEIVRCLHWTMHYWLHRGCTQTAGGPHKDGGDDCDTKVQQINHTNGFKISITSQICLWSLMMENS